MRKNEALSGSAEGGRSAAALYARPVKGCRAAAFHASNAMAAAG